MGWWWEELFPQQGSSSGHLELGTVHPRLCDEYSKPAVAAPDSAVCFFSKDTGELVSGGLEGVFCILWECLVREHLAVEHAALCMCNQRPPGPARGLFPNHSALPKTMTRELSHTCLLPSLNTTGSKGHKPTIIQAPTLS